MKTYLKITLATTVLAFSFLSLNGTFAHPGNTAADGCHYCRTNCGSWGVAWNQRHCHSTGTIIDPEPKIENKTETVKEVIEFETKYQEDSTLKKGETRVEQEGLVGEKTITFIVTYTDGLETNKKKTGEEITKKPTDKIILKGTKEEEPVVLVESEMSDSEAFFALAILAGMGYGAYRLVKRAKIKKEEA